MKLQSSFRPALVGLVCGLISCGPIAYAIWLTGEPGSVFAAAPGFLAMAGIVASLAVANVYFSEDEADAHKHA